MESFTNPFEQESDPLFNLALKVVMPENAKEDLSNQNIFGERLLQRIVEERIKKQSQPLGPHEEAKAFHLQDCKKKSQSKRRQEYCRADHMIGICL